MSAKQQLATVIAGLPDSISIEEAVERLYRAFKLKHATLPPREPEILPMTGDPSIADLSIEERLRRLDAGAGLLDAPPRTW